MSDICMCSGEHCPLKYRCYRALANPHEMYQSYFSIPPYDDEEGNCMYFWDLNKNSISED